MGLTLTVQPPSQQGQIESLQRELYRRNQELAECREELRQERVKRETVERGVVALRETLNPLHNGLKMIFGEMEAMGVGSSVTTATNPRIEAAWEDWKRKLGGQPAKAIDALLLHGALTQTQLRLHVGCANGSIAGIVYQLNKAGLINKNGGKISLKEL